MLQTMKVDGFKREVRARLGDKWLVELEDRLHKLAGMDPPSNSLFMRMGRGLTSNITGAKLWGRVSSMANHYLGGILSIVEYPGVGGKTMFLKNFFSRVARGKMLDSEYVRTHSGYFRDRAEHTGGSLENPEGDIAFGFGEGTRIGRVWNAAKEFGTKGIRFTDRMDVDDIQRTWRMIYMKDHPKASFEEASAWALPRSERTARRRLTVASDMDASYLSQQAKRYPFGGVPFVFTSKLGKMRAAIDTTVADFRAHPNKATAGALLLSLGTVGTMMGTYMAVGEGSKALKRGLTTRGEKREEDNWNTELTNVAAHTGDVILPGIFGRMIRYASNSFSDKPSEGVGSTILEEALVHTLQSLHKTIDNIDEGKLVAAAWKGVDFLNNAASFAGISLDDPVQYMKGAIRYATAEPTTRLQETARELAARGYDPQAEESESEKARSMARHELSDMLADKNPDYQNRMKKLRAEEVLNEADIKQIEKNAAKPKLERYMTRLGSEEAIHLWKMKDATPEERKTMQPMVLRKIIGDRHLSPFKQDALLAKAGIPKPVDLDFNREYSSLNKKKLDAAKAQKEYSAQKIGYAAYLAAKMTPADNSRLIRLETYHGLILPIRQKIKDDPSYEKAGEKRIADLIRNAK
jgi:hypothetical protein